MADSTLINQETGLAYYLRNEIYEPWKRERERLIEGKWQANLNAFNAVSDSFWKHEEAEDWRSDTFIQLTKMKIMGAYSMVTDMQLQGGRFPLTYVPSPWDRVRLEQLTEQERRILLESLEDMTQLVLQQMQDCRAQKQLKRCMLSGGIYGEYFAKRFVHEIERRNFVAQSMAPEGYQDMQGQYTRYEKQVDMVTQPAWEYKSVWSIFRDLETDNLQEGVGVVERQLISPYELRQKMNLPFYLPQAAERAIKEAPKKGTTEPADQSNTMSLPPWLREIDHRFKTMDYLEFWGRVPRKIVEEFEQTLDEPADYTIVQDVEDDGDEVEIMACLAGLEIVRYTRTVPHERPFYRGVWEEHLDHVDATGVADNLKDVQKVLNGLVRAYEDNTKLSSDVIIAFHESMFAPWDKKIKPGLVLNPNESLDDVRKGLQQVVIQNTGEQCISGIEFYERKGDEQSMLPRIIQGDIAEKKKPDTLGEMQMLFESAGKYLGGVIRNADEDLIEPLGRDFYEYNMEDPNIDPSVKGNFIAKPLGFTSFQNKVVRINALMTYLSLLISSELLAGEGKLRGILEEIAKGTDLEPSQVLKSAEEKQADQEATLEARKRDAAEGLQVAEMVKAMETRFEKFMAEVKAQLDMEKQAAKAELDMAKAEQEHEYTLLEQDQEAHLEVMVDAHKPKPAKSTK